MNGDATRPRDGLRTWQTAVLAGLILLCLAVRLAFIAPLDSKLLQGDEYTYDSIAYDLIHGNGYSLHHHARRLTAIRPPIYPFYLAFVYSVFGYSLFIGRLAQSLLEILTCLLLFVLARKLSDKFWVWALTLLGYAVNPVAVVSSAYMFSVPLFVLLFTLSMLALIWCYERRSVSLYALAGLVNGLATLCRPTSVAFPFAFLIAVLVCRPIRKHVLPLGMALYLVMCGVTLAPWIVRNYMVFRRFVPTVTMGSPAFRAGPVRRTEESFPVLTCPSVPNTSSG